MVAGQQPMSDSRARWLALVGELQRHDPEQIFKYPVMGTHTRLAKSYRELIKEPVCFVDIQKELPGLLSRGGDASVSARIDRIFLNAWAFNAHTAERHGVAVLALRMQRRLHLLLQREQLPLPPRVRPEDVVHPPPPVGLDHPGHCRGLAWMPYGGRCPSGRKRRAPMHAPPTRRRRIARCQSPQPASPDLGCEEQEHFEEYARELEGLESDALLRSDQFRQNQESAVPYTARAWRQLHADLQKLCDSLNELMWKIGLLSDMDDELRQMMVAAPTQEQWDTLMTRAIEVQARCEQTKEEVRDHINQGAVPQLLADCTQAVRAVAQLRGPGYFNSPVDPQEDGVPDYFDYVARPMCLNVVLKRLEEAIARGDGSYTVEMVEADVSQVWTNVDLYWDTDHDGVDAQTGAKVRKRRDICRAKWNIEFLSALGKNLLAPSGGRLRNCPDELQAHVAEIRAKTEQLQREALERERRQGAIPMGPAQTQRLRSSVEGHIFGNTPTCERISALLSGDPSVRTEEDGGINFEISELAAATQWALWELVTAAPAAESHEPSPPAGASGSQAEAQAAAGSRGAGPPGSTAVECGLSPGLSADAYRSPRADCGGLGSLDGDGGSGEGSVDSIGARAPSGARDALDPDFGPDCLGEVGQGKPGDVRSGAASTDYDSGGDDDEDAGGWRVFGKSRQGGADATSLDGEVAQAREELSRRDAAAAAADERDPGPAPEADGEEDRLALERLKHELAEDRERQCRESGLHADADFGSAMNEWEDDEDGRVDNCFPLMLSEDGQPKTLEGLFDSCPTPKVYAAPPSVIRDGTSQVRQDSSVSRKDRSVGGSTPRSSRAPSPQKQPAAPAGAAAAATGGGSTPGRSPSGPAAALPSLRQVEQQQQQQRKEGSRSKQGSLQGSPSDCFPELVPQARAAWDPGDGGGTPDPSNLVAT